MALPRLENAQLNEKRVLLRVDLDDSFDPATGRVDEVKIRSFSPTIEWLLSRGASVLLAGHSGKSASGAPGFRELAPEIGKILGHEVGFIENPAEPAAQERARGIRSGQILMLENLFRFEGEIKGSKEFAKQLASLADLFVNDSLESCLFSFASITGVPALLPSYAGLSFYKNLEALQYMVSRPERPFVVILGGVNLEKKIRLLQKLLGNPNSRIDTILLGGGIAYTFMKSRAIPVGNSFVEGNREVEAFQVIEKSELIECETLLPMDHVVAEEYSRDARTRVVKQNEIPNRWIGMDIGPKTVARTEKVLKKAATIFWYGPLGVVELDPFRKGTAAVGKAVARSRARTVVAGRDTVRFLQSNDLAGGAHTVTGSDVMLEVLMGNQLPGVEALKSSKQ